MVLQLQQTFKNPQNEGSQNNCEYNIAANLFQYLLILRILLIVNICEMNKNEPVQLHEN